MNFIDFLQLQKGRMVAEWVKYLIFDFFSETALKKLDGKQVPKVFSNVCLFWADQSVFYQIPFSVCTTIIF